MGGSFYQSGNQKTETLIENIDLISFITVSNQRKTGKECYNKSSVLLSRQCNIGNTIFWQIYQFKERMKFLHTSDGI